MVFQKFRRSQCDASADGLVNAVRCYSVVNCAKQGLALLLIDVADVFVSIKMSKCRHFNTRCPSCYTIFKTGIFVGYNWSFTRHR